MVPVAHKNAKHAPAPLGDVERAFKALVSWAEEWWPSPHGDLHAVLADLEETDDAFILDVDLPGIDKKDVDLEIDGRRVTVVAERKERERTGILRRRTRTVGMHRHEIVLPADVDDDGVEATLADGVLTVRLPKQHAGRRRRITVT